LFDQKYIHLNHHVHGLQQILREIAFLQKKRVKSVMDIVLKIV
jgi:hypothetical protein